MLEYHPSTEWTPHSAAYCNRDNTIIYRSPQIGTLHLEGEKKPQCLSNSLQLNPWKNRFKSNFWSIQVSLSCDCPSWFNYHLSIDKMNISYRESYFPSIDRIFYMEYSRSNLIYIYINVVSEMVQIRPGILRTLYFYLNYLRTKTDQRILN